MPVMTLDLTKPGLLRIIGVHDPLSALLCGRGGYDALWLSSLGVSSAGFGIPDAGLITLTEMMDTVKRVRLVSDLPIIVDADTGYGDVLNVRRATHEAALYGVNALCIEDAAFPKRNSFVDAKHRRLADVHTMCERVAAVCRSRRDGYPLIIARVEALTQGQDLGSALERAAAYAEAGADSILVHSVASSGTQVIEFARRWHARRPILVVPTAYPQVPFRQFEDVGIKGVVLANQLLRAAFRAMGEVSRRLTVAEAPVAVEDELAAVQEIHEVVGLYGCLKFEGAVVREGAAAGALVSPPRSKRGVHPSPVNSSEGLSRAPSRSARVRPEPGH